MDKWTKRVEACHCFRFHRQNWKYSRHIPDVLGLNLASPARLRGFSQSLQVNVLIEGLPLTIVSFQILVYSTFMTTY
jgi:hypothetical protein